MKVEVVPGEIEINSITQLIDHPDVKIFEVDCHSKYPQWLSGRLYGGNKQVSNSVDLFADENTLHKSAIKGITRINFSEYEDDWFTIVEGGRYTVQITLYHIPKYRTIPHKVVYLQEK